MRGRLGRRRDLLRVAEGLVGAARGRAAVPVGACHGEDPDAEDEARVVRLGLEARRRLLGVVRGKVVSPHGRGLHVLRDEGGAGDRE